MTAPTEGSRWRRWRRSRPFYGGLLMILSALELFFSASSRSFSAASIFSFSEASTLSLYSATAFFVL